jgi:glycosyltransferase involved in cell wall biosynthesis
VPSHTFIREGIAAVPGYRPVVVCEEVEAAPPTGGPSRRSTLALPVRSIGWAQRLPSGIAGKARIAATAIAARRSALVHAHFGHELVLADRVARLTRRPWIASLHGHDALVELPAPSGAPGREALRRADAITVPSEFLAEHVLALGVAPDRVVVAPSGVDVAALPFRARHRGPDEPTEVLFIGRFVDKKGVLDAAAAVVAADRRSPLRARFVGGGPLDPELRTLLGPLGDRAQVVDGTDRGVVLDALTHAHVVLSPSRTAPDGDADTLLMVNLEAQACGIPVVTTRHGGIPSAVDPAAAVLVPEGDTAALARALAEVAANPSRWEAMGAAGRRFVETGFTVEVAGHRTAALYDRISSGS